MRKLGRKVFAAGAAILLTVQTAEASVIKQETLTNKKISGTTVITTMYSENGLIDQIYWENEDYTLVPEYTYDEKGNPSEIQITLENGEEDFRLKMCLNTVYEDEKVSEVTGTYLDDKEEIISEENGVPDEAFSMIKVLEKGLVNYTEYKDCVASFPGVGTGFEKRDGEVYSVTVLENIGQCIKYEYDGKHEINNIQLIAGEETASMRYEKDDLGRISCCIYDQEAETEEHSIEYAESEDEDGNIVYSDVEGYGFNYTFDESGKLLSRSQRITGSQTDFYDGDGKLIRQEKSYGGTEPGMVTEYEYY